MVDKDNLARNPQAFLVFQDLKEGTFVPNITVD